MLNVYKIRIVAFQTTKKFILSLSKYKLMKKIVLLLLLVVLTSGCINWERRYVANPENVTEESHLECVDYVCTEVSGEGENQCSATLDCVIPTNQSNSTTNTTTPRHRGGGGGGTSTQDNSLPVPTHLECVANSCVELEGEGLDMCTSDLNCTCYIDSDCDDLNNCTSNTCVQIEGASPSCVFTALPDTTSCEDGISCTETDQCTAGVCGGIINNNLCTDGLFCNGVETCDILLGCQVGTPLVIDDDVSCTIDVCNDDLDIIEHTPYDSLCSNGLTCDGVETCNALLDCWAGTPVDCSSNNILGVATCLYVPDGIDVTRDFRSEFISSCNEIIDSCSVGVLTITHNCNVFCGAECDANNNCAPTNCGGPDRCIGNDYYNYSDDIVNSCLTNCNCELNPCVVPVITFNDPSCTTFSCTDGIQNGDETGVDCGGSCDPCVVTPTCTDGIQNGDETGVDCGGSCDPCTLTTKFGMGVPLRTDAEMTFSAEKLADLNVNKTRIWENWGLREPVQDQESWGGLDSRIIDFAEATHSTFVLTLKPVGLDSSNNPYWYCDPATANENSCVFQTQYEQDFQDYVSNVTRRYSNRIDKIQFSNEWDSTLQFVGSEQDYVKYANWVYDITKINSPETEVVLGSVTKWPLVVLAGCQLHTITEVVLDNGTLINESTMTGLCNNPDANNRLDRLEYALTNARYDSVDIHLYDDPANWDEYMAALRTLTDKPIIITEFGGPNEDDLRFDAYNETYQAEELRKYLDKILELNVTEAYYFTLIQSPTSTAVNHPLSSLISYVNGDAIVKPNYNVFKEYITTIPASPAQKQKDKTLTLIVFGIFALLAIIIYLISLLLNKNHK